MSTLLYDVLSGLTDNISGIVSSFNRYDEDLGALLSSIPTVPDTGSDEIQYSSKTKVNDLSGAVSYSLNDSKVYRTTISADTTFTLPEINDLEYYHEIILSVKYLTGGNPIPTQIPCAFFESDTSVVLKGNNSFDFEDVAQYHCKYESLMPGWIVMPMKLN